MSGRASAPVTGVRSACSYIILGIILLSGLLGCQQTWPTGPLNPPPGPAYLATDRTPAVRKSAAEELGPEVAAEIPPLPPKQIAPPDPGAEAFVDVIAAVIADDPGVRNGVTTIGLRHVRNQSRASASEFGRFIRRLADLLSEAGEEEAMIFLDESEGEADYEVLGAAYLVTAAGIDQWELFLRMSPATASWTVWEASSPLRVIRHPRPGQPQILAWPTGR